MGGHLSGGMAAEERHASRTATACSSRIDSLGSGEGVVWRRHLRRMRCVRAARVRIAQMGTIHGGQRVADEYVPISWETCPLSGANYPWMTPSLSQVDVLANGAWEPTGVRETQDRSGQSTEGNSSLIGARWHGAWLDAAVSPRCKASRTPIPSGWRLVMHAVIELDEPMRALTALSERRSGTGERTGAAKMVLIERATPKSYLGRL